MTKIIKYYFNIGDTYYIGDTTYIVRNRYVDEKGHKRYSIECGKCHDIADKSEKYIKQAINGTKNIKGNGCRKCSGQHRDSLERNNIAETHPWIVKLFKDPAEALTVSYGSGQKKIFVCPMCGTEKELTVKQAVRDGRIACPNCSETISYPNRFGFAVFTQLHLNDFENEYSPIWGQGKRYDFTFVIDDKRYIIEMDGTFHYESAYNGEVNLEKTKANDELKDKLAYLNDCKLIRIDCRRSDFNYIKNNFVNSELSHILDLSVINWDIVHEKIASNLLKDVCKYYNNNKDISFDDIGIVFGICGHTVRKYITKGTELGLCKFETVVEKYRNNYNAVVKYAKIHQDCHISEIADIFNLNYHNIRSYLTKALECGDIESFPNYYEIKKQKTIKIIKDNPTATKSYLCELAHCSHQYLNKCIGELNSA